MLPDAFEQSTEALLSTLRTLRHDLHAHPELGFEEVRTQAKVRAWLEDLGYAPRDCAETGLIADLHPERPTALALRADLDALPMQETTALPYRSTHDGRAHKCGHDGHTAILMGVAAVLAEHKDRLTHNVRLLFQPAEEGVRGGGARVMVQEGALEGVPEVYGLHNWPGFTKGEVRVRAGALMAQVHTIRLTVRGKGGHGSQPQKCIDPIVAAAQMVVGLQTVVSRSLGYEGGAVVSIGRFIGAGSHNVIPEQVELQGTVRTFDADVSETVIAGIRRIVEGTAQAHGVTADLQIEVGYPVLVNDEACAARVARIATKLVGAERVSEVGLPIAGGEDFAYMSNEVPGAYFFLGAQKPGEATPECHHPDFDFDDGLIPLGIRMFVGLALEQAAK